MKAIVAAGFILLLGVLSLIAYQEYEHSQLIQQDSGGDGGEAVAEKTARDKAAAQAVAAKEQAVAQAADDVRKAQEAAEKAREEAEKAVDELSVARKALLNQPQVQSQAGGVVQKSTESKPTPIEVISAIKKMGGKFEFDSNKAVVAVEFPLNPPKVTDAELLQLHLKGLTAKDLVDYFSLTRISVAGLVHLEGMKNLRSLSLHHTNVTDTGLVYLKGLTNLEDLNLDYTKVTDAGLVHLKGLTKLKILSLGGTKVTGTGLSHLKGLTKLNILSLVGASVTNAGLVGVKGMIGLRGLFLSKTEVTDAGLVHLKGLKNLGLLGLAGTKVTDAGVKNLQQALPKCEITRQ